MTGEIHLRATSSIIAGKLLSIFTLLFLFAILFIYRRYVPIPEPAPVECPTSIQAPPLIPKKKEALTSFRQESPFYPEKTALLSQAFA